MEKAIENDKGRRMSRRRAEKYMQMNEKRQCQEKEIYVPSSEVDRRYKTPTGKKEKQKRKYTESSATSPTNGAAFQIEF